MPVNISEMWKGLGPQGRGAVLGSLIGGGGLAALSALSSDEEDNKWAKGLKGLAIGAPLGALAGGVGMHLAQPSAAPAAQPSTSSAASAATGSGNPAHMLTRAYKQMFPWLAASSSGQASSPNQLGLWDYLRKREAGVGHDLQRMWRGVDPALRDNPSLIPGAVLNNAFSGAASQLPDSSGLSQRLLSTRGLASGGIGLTAAGTTALLQPPIRSTVGSPGFRGPLRALQISRFGQRIPGLSSARIPLRLDRSILPILAGLLTSGTMYNLPNRGNE